MTVSFRTSSLLCLAVPLLFLAGAPRRLAAELPAAPSSQISAPTTAATLTGFITDVDGAVIAGAHLTLTPTSRSAAPDPPPLVTTTAPDGSFTFSSVPPGPFTLAIAAPGFAATQSSGELHPAETRELPDIALRSASITTIQVDADPTRIAEAQIHLEEQQRVLGTIPNFYVVYDANPAPLSSRQKFSLAYRTQIDPINLALTAAIAGAQQAAHTYAWELGASGYGKRLSASYGTFLTGNFLTDAILPAVFHQDPRYYYKGTGTIHRRIGYALANAVICKGDNGHWQPNYSAILGTLAASGISNFYYPAPNRAGASLTFEGAALGTGFGAFGNLMQEFVVRRLTPHTHPPAPKQ